VISHDQARQNQHFFISCFVFRREAVSGGEQKQKERKAKTRISSQRRIMYQAPLCLWKKAHKRKKNKKTSLFVVHTVP
jgi:hypothetical protein